METLALYFGKMLLCSAMMFGYYQIFLKDRTFHHYNRFYLVATLLTSALLPLLKLEHLTIETDNRIFLLLSKMQQLPEQNPASASDGFNLWWLPGIASALLVLRLLWGILKINRLKNEFPAEELHGIRFYRTNLSEAPFSFFRSLFWRNSLDVGSAAGQQILKHEMVHIEQGHSFDKLLAQVFSAAFWFNPVFHLISRELSLIHEYLADKKAVKQSDTKAFAQMLLAGSFSGNTLPATSPFLNSNLKKRLQMLKKSKTRFAYLRKLFALPLLFVLAFSYLVTAKNREIADTNKLIAETVATMQTDTAKNVELPAAPPIPPAVETPKRPVSKVLKVPAVKNINREKIDQLSKDLRKKTRELRKLKPETPKFNEKVKEINQLTQKIQQNVSWPHLTTVDGVRVINFNDKDFRVDLRELEKHTENIRKQFDSEEFKARMKENEAFFKSEEFKQRMKELPRLRAVSRFESMEDLQENARKLADSARLNASKYSAKAELAAKKAALAKEQAELAKKQADLMKKEIELYGHVPQPKFMIIDGKTVRTPRPGIVTGGFEGAKITIDGKPATEQQLKALKPEEITRMDVNKSTVDGESRNEIKVETKRK